MECDAFAHHYSRLNSAKIAPVREVNLDSSFNEARKRNSNFLPELSAACLKGWGPDVELGIDLDLGGAVSADLEAQP